MALLGWEGEGCSVKAVPRGLFLDGFLFAGVFQGVAAHDGVEQRGFVNGWSLGSGGGRRSGSRFPRRRGGTRGGGRVVTRQEVGHRPGQGTEAGTVLPRARREWGGERLDRMASTA